MSILKLIDDYQIIMLYQQFKNQTLTNKSRFYYAKLLIEQCISKIIAFPEKESIHYFDLSVVNSNDKLLKYLNSIVYKFDIETIELLDIKIKLSKFDQTDDTQLFRRLAMLLFNIINNEISFLKENINSSLESEIQEEIDLLVSRMDSFINNEDQIEKLEYELGDLKSVYSFNNDDAIKCDIKKIGDQISELKSVDLFTNQKKLDELQLLHTKITKNESVNETIEDISNLKNNSTKNVKTDIYVFESQTDSELIKRCPDLNFLVNTDLYKDFLILYEKGMFHELEIKMKEIRSSFFSHNNYPQYVFKETILDHLMFYLPVTERELLGIKYVGKVIITSVGKELLKVINTSLESNQNLKSHKEKMDSFLSKFKVKNPTNRNTKFLNAYATWDKKQEELLISYFNQKISISDISKKMQRSKGSINAKLKKLGYIL